MSRLQATPSILFPPLAGATMTKNPSLMVSCTIFAIFVTTNFKAYEKQSNSIGYDMLGNDHDRLGTGGKLFG